MELVLLNHKNSGNINDFSGTSYFMSEAFRKEFQGLKEFNDFELPQRLQSIVKGNFKKQFNSVGKEFSKYLFNLDIKPDFILCQGGNSMIPLYNNNIPIAFWHDSTWLTLLQGYKDKKSFNKFKADYRNFYLWDKTVLERADLVIFTSEFIADACHSYYNIQRDKIKIVPFGANLSTLPNQKVLKESIDSRALNKTLNLTFIGKDWRRKGLIAAFNLTKRLNYNGIDTTLKVIGCKPQLPDLINSSFVTIYGFMNKQDIDHLKQLERILLSTHFLVHPALSEPFGIVLCEANAFGIPVLGTSVEGLKTIVRDGQNGFLFKKNKFINGAADKILDIWSNFEMKYPGLCTSTLSTYNESLNWSSNVKAVRTLLENF